MTSSLLPRIDQSPDSLPVLRIRTADGPGWVAAHRDALRSALPDCGSILIRGLALSTIDEVGETFRGLAPGGLMTERETLTPRTSHGNEVYSSTKWPANQFMCMHHELSYAATFPATMLFACLQAPDEGGATAVADSTAVLEALPDNLVRRFEREGWLLTRAYNADVGASVEQAFGTADREQIERYCRAHDIRFQWRPDGQLRTRQRRKAIASHPVTGQHCWFNQVAFLNEWTLDPEVREFLIDVYGPDELPFNTYFGDGEPIGADLIKSINDVYQAHTVREAWQAGDLLIVDNIRSAHAREPFTGPREVLAAMADPVQQPEYMSYIPSGT